MFLDRVNLHLENTMCSISNWPEGLVECLQIKMEGSPARYVFLCFCCVFAFVGWALVHLAGFVSTRRKKPRHPRSSPKILTEVRGSVFVWVLNASKGGKLYFGLLGHCWQPADHNWPTRQGRFSKPTCCSAYSHDADLVAGCWKILRWTPLFVPQLPRLPWTRRLLRLKGGNGCFCYHFLQMFLLCLQRNASSLLNRYVRNSWLSMTTFPWYIYIYIISPCHIEFLDETTSVEHQLTIAWMSDLFRCSQRLLCGGVPHKKMQTVEK